MTEHKHTKGPWTERYNQGFKTIYADRELAAEIAVIKNPHFRTEHEANARLISAAPELLEALEDFVKYVENDIDLDMINIKPELQKARAALAKARGQN